MKEAKRLNRILGIRPAAKKIMNDHELVEKDLHAVMRDLKSVEAAWQAHKNSTARFALYDFLGAMITIIVKWDTKGKLKDYIKLAASMKGLQPAKTVVAVVIDCTADDLSKLGPKRRREEQKKRSKWVRAIYAARKQGVSPSKIAAYLRRHSMNVVLDGSIPPRKR
jgi:aminoglycoside/choline kinase family phosphotransferase